MNVENTIKYLEERTRFVITFLYSWLTHEGEPLGYILGVFHTIVSTGMVVLVILSHTLYPALWLKIVTYCLLMIIWIQHITLKVCIFTVAEKKLTQNEAPYFKIFNDILGFDGEILVDYLVVFETGILCGFSLEFLNLLFQQIYSYNQIYF